uniref:FAD/FMN-containing dehydrogenase n=1 Tax=uncultured bacterium CSLG7 TaxID=1091577 RepID=G4WV43_9BACT|nr:FAD/FMN-containing dehydrogenase [uncultured bacterium CSLG7]
MQVRTLGPALITQDTHESAAEALEQWTSLLGSEHVFADAQSRTVAETATFATTQKVPAVLEPGSRDEVQECIRIANRFRIPVYPISSGKNWGYGSRVPVNDANVLIDLGRLNRILDFNEKLAYITVEPGVTQRQLFEFLQARKSGLWMDATGSSPECSLIGNVVERGFGHTPYGDHFAQVCGLEVVLPTGALVETGFCRFPGSQAGAAYRWGAGPTLDGLFSQSNLGIVTRMTIWLMPAPEHFEAFFFQCNREDQLAALIEALRPLRLQGILRSTVHIANDYKVLGGIQQFPWQETNGETPLRPELMSQLRSRLKFGAWSGSGGLYGTRGQIAEAKRVIRKGLKGKVDRLQFLDDRRLAFASRFAKLYQFMTGWDLSRTLDLARPVYGLMKGVPTKAPLASAYWRKKSAPPSDMDPDRDGCGLLWHAPIVPMEGRQAAIVVEIAHRVLLTHGFEPSISMTLITERAVACVISICYDRSEPGQDDQAMACYRRLRQELTDRGYYSYRLGIQAMSEMSGTDGYAGLVRAIKDAVDPNGVLAPGRYEPAPIRSRSKATASHE